MTEAEARARLERMLANDVEPNLSDAEVQDLIFMARRMDLYGTSAESTSWAPTYNLAAAAAEGWRWKAAKVSGNYSFSADGSSFNRNEVHKHCLEMSRHYAAMSGIDAVRISAQTLPITSNVVGNL